MRHGDLVTVGVDVGAPRKGYHAIALAAAPDGHSKFARPNADPAKCFRKVSKFHAFDARDVAGWCVEQDAAVVAVDAPCRWRATGGAARAAERELAAARISCFSTPTIERAQGRSFYTWMFAGQELYSALSSQYPIYEGGAVTGPIAIETFPQAVACTLAGETVSARSKLANRTELLARAGIDTSSLVSIDEIDGALCALTARFFLEQRFKAYGESATGFIIVPAEALPLPTGAALERWNRMRVAGSQNRNGKALTQVMNLLPKLSAAERATVANALRDYEDAGGDLGPC